MTARWTHGEIEALALPKPAPAILGAVVDTLPPDVADRLVDNLLERFAAIAPVLRETDALAVVDAASYAAVMDALADKLEQPVSDLKIAQQILAAMLLCEDEEAIETMAVLDPIDRRTVWRGYAYLLEMTVGLLVEAYGLDGGRQRVVRILANATANALAAGGADA